MPRTSRIIAPGLPHHVTQRGNRRQDVFFKEEDYELYLDLMTEWCRHAGVEIWAYCLMTNHVHLIAIPSSIGSLASAIGEAHRRYTVEINRREKWTGHLWQGRFSSFVMDEPYALQAARYVEMNPVAAKIAVKPDDYKWSSAAAHLQNRNDRLLAPSKPFLNLVNDWHAHLHEDDSDFSNRAIYHETSGWPMGDKAFLDNLSVEIKCVTAPGPKGRPRKLND